MPDDPAICEMLEMMPCNQHPSCVWDNQGPACNPA